MFNNPLNPFHRSVRTIGLLAFLFFAALLLARITGPVKFKDPNTIKAFQTQGAVYTGFIQRVHSQGVPFNEAIELVNRYLSQTLPTSVPAPSPGEPPAFPAPASTDTEYTSARSRTLMAPYIKQFFENAPNEPYWAEPGMGTLVECVGLIKRYQEEVLGLDFSYLPNHNSADARYMTWPNDVGNGWPNYSIKKLLDGHASIFDPNPPEGKNVITFPDGKRYRFHIVTIPPNMSNQLEFGDILIFGSLQDALNGTAGHVGLFAAYPDGPDGPRVMVLDENGGSGSESRIEADAIQFHTFNKNWLNDQAIAVRVILDEEIA